MSESIIKVENIGKKYSIGLKEPYYSLRDQIAQLWSFKKKATNEDFWALRDVNFEIKQGESVGIIGRNGAGKSTLLKILSQITPPTTGKITMHGRVASLLEVGTGFNPELTGRENIFLNGSILGMSRNEVKRKFDQIVSFAEIEKFLDTPVKRYSSGMYVRLAFAVAAHLDSEILIVDEVLAVGDSQFQKKCLGKMDEVTKKEGRTILFVSHNMGVVHNLCKRVICLNDGKVVMDGKTEKVIDYYGNLSAVHQKEGLAQRKDRTGDQKVKIVDFWMENERGEKINTITCGRDISLVFSYECKDAPASQVDIGFSLHQADGTTVSILYSSYMGEYLTLKENKGKMKFKTENLPLNHGVYRIAVRVVVDRIESDYILNEIATIEIAPGDFYHTGNTVPDHDGVLLINGKWNV